MQEKENAHDAGMGTTPGMWEMVSDALAGEALPESINKALYALREGRAHVVEVEFPNDTD